MVKENVVIGVVTGMSSCTCACGVDEYTVVWRHVEWILLVLRDKVPIGTSVLSRIDY